MSYLEISINYKNNHLFFLFSMILAMSCFIIYNKAGSVYICSELLMFYILPSFLEAFKLLI